jgi:PAS domain S-box-containing protein
MNNDHTMINKIHDLESITQRYHSPPSSRSPVALGVKAEISRWVTVSSTSDIMEDHDDINLLMQRTAESLANAIGADQVRLVFLIDAMGTRSHIVRYGGDQVEDQTVTTSLDAILEANVHDQLPTGLGNLQTCQRHPDCTFYIATSDILQKHGLQTGLFVTLARGETRLAMFSGRSATGAVYAESEARRVCELLDIAALAASQFAAMHRIAQAKHQCESIMDTLPQLVALIDKQGHVIRTNLTLEQWNLGKVGAIRGVSFHDMLHPSCNDWNCGLRTLWDNLWQQFKEGDPVQSEFHDDQLDRDLHLTLTSPPKFRYGQETGEQACASLVLEDISRRAHAERMLNSYNEELEQRLQEKTLELSRANAELRVKMQEHISVAETLRESEQRYSCIVESTLTGIYVIQNNQLVFCNRRFSELFGYPHEAILRLDLKQLFPDEEEQTLTDLLANSGNADPIFDEKVVRGLNRNGETLWLQRILTRVDCMGNPMIMGNVIDITVQKKMEEALRSSRDELQMISRRLISTQEIERKRIAGELHDSIGQIISAVMICVENALSEREENTPQYGETYLYKAITKLRTTMDEVRRISQDLRPAMLDDLGLIATINWFCRDMQSLLTQVKLRKQIEVVEEQIPVDLKIVIFRILQEALNNIVKHARASNVYIRLKKSDDTLELLIDDDGQGFAMESGVEAHRFGLDSMMERVRLSDGRCTIESAPGTGTTLLALWETSDDHTVTD